MRQSSHPGLKQMNWEIQAAELNFNRVISHDIKDPNTSATGELLLLMEYFSKTVFPISGPRDPPDPLALQSCCLIRGWLIPETAGALNKLRRSRMHSGKDVKHPLCFLLLSWHRRKSSEKLCQATRKDINPKQLLFSATPRREITRLKHFHLSVIFKQSGDTSGRTSRWIDLFNNPLANVSIQPCVSPSSDDKCVQDVCWYLSWMPFILDNVTMKQ